MKRTAILSFAALGLAACSQNTPQAQSNAPPPVPADATASMSNAMPMSNGMMGGNAAAPMSAKTGDSTGVVKSVDAAAGTITLDHQPIPGVGWPAMTMTFTGTPPSLLRGITAGDHVKFSVRIEGDRNEVTAISKE